MEKRNTLLLTVIAIATLLVAVVGATFAYFASDVGTVNNENTNPNPTSTAFFNSNGATMLLGVSADNIATSEIGQNYANNQSSLQIIYNAAGTRETSCTYDVYFRWTSADKFIAHTKYLLDGEYVDNVGKEFTTTVSTVVESSTGSGITGTSFVDGITTDENHEIDFSELKDCDTTVGCKIGSGIVYSNTNEEGKPTKVTWNFKNTIYNLGTNQADEIYGIANKNYTGDFFVTNIHC